MDKGDLVDELMGIRGFWTAQDFKDAYGDEWFEMPLSLKECFEVMEEYLYNTYDEDYLEEVIEDERI